MKTLIGLLLTVSFMSTAHAEVVSDFYRDKAAKGISGSRVCEVEITGWNKDLVSLVCDGSTVIEPIYAYIGFPADLRVTAILDAAVENGFTIQFRSETSMFLVKTQSK
jgi:hypothetical protein